MRAEDPTRQIERLQREVREWRVLHDRLRAERNEALAVLRRIGRWRGYHSATQCRDVAWEVLHRLTPPLGGRRVFGDRRKKSKKPQEDTPVSEDILRPQRLPSP
jgi:hypothetical protein